MPIKTWLSIATAALLIAGGLGVTMVGAATPSCGSNCVDFSSALFGPAGTPAFVLADAPQVQKVGQPLTLARASATNPGEDFTLENEGTVNDFITVGLINPGMGIYGSLEAWQIEYTPSGVATGLCVGVGTTPANGTGVALEPCGVSSKTIWIIDPANGVSSSDSQLISGATASNFSDPQVMSVLRPGLPLFTSALHKSSGGTVFANQQWASKTGSL